MQLSRNRQLAGSWKSDSRGQSKKNSQQRQRHSSEKNNIVLTTITLDFKWSFRTQQNLVKNELCAKKRKISLRRTLFVELRK